MSMRRRAGDAVQKVIEFQGMPIHLDRPEGFVQRLDTPEGPKDRVYTCDYGFFPGVMDHDGEELDCFVGPSPDADTVYVIRQNKHDGTFDEHKCLLGFDSIEDAIQTYADHIPPKLIRSVSPMSMSEFQNQYLADAMDRAAVLRVADRAARLNPKKPTQSVTLTVQGEGGRDLLDFLESCGEQAATGHSFSIFADPYDSTVKTMKLEPWKEDQTQTVFLDGDGDFRLEISKVASRYLKSKGFATNDALRKYLEEHPKADRTKHWVEHHNPELPKAKTIPEGWGLAETHPKQKQDGHATGAAGSQLDPKLLTKLKDLGVTKLPAAHIGKVYVSKNLGNDGALLRWIDDHGKEQRTYSAEFDRKNAEQKWKRVTKNRPRVEAAIKQLRVNAEKDPASAACLLIAETGLRPGSENSVEQLHHYGATTMLKKHISFSGDTAKIEYVGKEGVTNHATLTDPKLVNALKGLVHDKKPDDKVFNIPKSAVAQAAPKGFKLKDFRTIMATSTAEKLLRDHPYKPTGDKKKDARSIIGILKQVSSEVSKKLNNTPAMARRSYIAPQVIQEWGKRNGIDEAWLK